MEISSFHNDSSQAGFKWKSERARGLCAHGWDPSDSRYYQSPDCMNEEDEMAVGVGRCLKRP